MTCSILLTQGAFTQQRHASGADDGVLLIELRNSRWGLSCCWRAFKSRHATGGRA